MTSTVMLAALRTTLDESSADFWTDPEAYAALADGQNQVIERLLAVYRAKKKEDEYASLPYELESLLNDDTGTTQTVAVPPGFLELVGAFFNYNDTIGLKPCKIMNNLDSYFFTEDNSYMSATGSNPLVGISSVSDVVSIFFVPTIEGTGSFSINYLKSPADIASGQNATLPVTTHNAIVNYAASRMLEKDQRIQEAQIQYNLFLKGIEGL
jgi:hypothetical protein